MGIWAPIPYVGSFQRGTIHRGGDPVNSTWREIERFGTIENITRIVSAKGYDPSSARVASLRVRQAVELRRASREGSVLTRPLVLYYALLNLTRAVLITFVGDMGATSHGLKYSARPSLLESTGEVTKKGTFAHFVSSLGYREDLIGRKLSLRDLLAVLPEMRKDFRLLNSGPSATAAIKVNAFLDADEMTLRFYVEDISETDFRDKWKELLHWLADVCEIDAAPFTLRVKAPPKGEENIALFCKKYLIPDNVWRENAVWCDHVARPDVTLLPPMGAYLGALFILSNVSRYEPERLAEPTREVTDFGFVLTSLLDNAERFFPQLILGLVSGSPVYFQ